MAIHVYGSIALDRLMTFPGRFADHLLADKLDKIGVSFVVNSLEEKRGGTGGNIVYSLSLLGESPRLYGAVGRDFGAYEAFLSQRNINLDGVRRVAESYTASAYINSDSQGNQITSFNPGAMSFSFDSKVLAAAIQEGDWCLAAPGHVPDMVNMAEFCRKQHIPFVFDPGQQSLAMQPEELISAMQDAACMIGNDYEIDLICHKTGLAQEDLLKRVQSLIITRGADGSEIFKAQSNWSAKIPPATRPESIPDPTGAGDAYRAGLLKGLQAGLDLTASARLGSVCSSFAIEYSGTQEHNFSQAEFRQRHEAAYGPLPSLLWGK